ncbi:MAG: [FeFe] hydrogenase H-cluster radical SAM maturase HydE [Bradymonadales bacterium]|nr:[FeFe] hydrogenase H-cluster radical SAM maturase HydE [Bradymonadales bacterium]
MAIVSDHPSSHRSSSDPARRPGEEEILDWLQEDRPERLELLWRQADRVRHQNVGDAVHLRGLIEISNHCTRRCAYCGVRAPNRRARRYRMTPQQILECVHLAVERGFGTVVLQSGEDPRHTGGWVADLVGRIKGETPLAVTLSLGERTAEDLVLWRQAGADRYLLRFETSNRELYDRVHPPAKGTVSDRIALLRLLREIGYEVGSGIMIGLWGQSWQDLATDIALFAKLDLDMIGLGPYIPHPDTPMAQHPDRYRLPPERQVPADELTTHKALALARILCPEVNIPATTAMTTINPEQGLELALSRGANVFMPNLTPDDHRARYTIYPSKTSLVHRDEESYHHLQHRLQALGREVGAGRGDSVRYSRRHP